MLGDFNIVRFHSERYGGSLNFSQAILDFHDSILQADLYDLPFIGPLYTWTNKREDSSLIVRKLDRALMNDRWLDCFPQSTTVFCNPADFCTEEKECLRNYIDLATAEEAFLKQKSRIN
ncbi:hypothetical protein L1049_018633 [Liquidambar formosana]|uniref:Endonuclease/exonuclease/phosphatase domain-containing protein n=1 Tax=Liquidambar formosana TaxID=63359 RepID=A0AAP0RAC0_LIQFO